MQSVWIVPFPQPTEWKVQSKMHLTAGHVIYRKLFGLAPVLWGRTFSGAFWNPPKQMNVPVKRFRCESCQPCGPISQQLPQLCRRVRAQRGHIKCHPLWNTAPDWWIPQPQFYQRCRFKRGWRHAGETARLRILIPTSLTISSKWVGLAGDCYVFLGTFIQVLLSLDW